MSRIADTFTRLRAEHRSALMPYVTIGFPRRETTLDLIPALEQAGADMFELGIPFSDPVADGPTIQQAAQRALENGVTLSYCFETVAALRQRGVHVPLLLMGYYNPILRYGLEKACTELAAAGGDGWIIPDLPPEESDEFNGYAHTYHLDVIQFVAPTTPASRIATIASKATGFLYCVSVAGVTGSRPSLSDDLPPFLARVRQHAPNIPLVVGFGISTAEHVEQVSMYADGAIVGSALIRCLEQAPPDRVVEEGATFVRALRGKANSQ
jgi:tryptophan synthase alpha chain